MFYGGDQPISSYAEFSFEIYRCKTSKKGRIHISFKPEDVFYTAQSVIVLIQTILLI